MSKYQTSERVLVPRSALAAAPYNPRRIDEPARRRLRENIETRGLMGGIVWNRRTSNLVAGHQRLSILDTLHQGEPYSLWVEAVDLDEAAEKEQNLFMNNPSAQGDWDMVALEKIIKEGTIKLDAAGFNAAEVYRAFGSAAVIERPQDLQALSEQMRAAHELNRQVKAKIDSSDDIDCYHAFVYRDSAQFAEVVGLLGLPDSRFQDGEHLLTRLRELFTSATSATT